MYQHSSKKTYESQVCEGVKITLRKTNEKRRAELMRSLAQPVEQEQALIKLFGAIRERAIPVWDGVDEQGNQKPKMDLETCEQVKDLSPEDTEAASKLLAELDAHKTLVMNPLFIRWGVSAVDGLEIDGRAATVEDLLGDDCPDGLVDEIIGVLQGKIDLTPAEKKILSAPAISESQEPHTTQVSSATTASATETLQDATALSSSLSK
jgi:hypothetical protein